MHGVFKKRVRKSGYLIAATACPKTFTDRKYKIMIDLKSIVLCSITLFTGLYANLTLGHAIAIVSVLAGITTIVYNMIRIYKEVKKEK